LNRAERPEKPALSEVEGSPTVFNLGYTPEVAEGHAHAAQVCGGVSTDHPRERVRARG
jgi:hypothetical protein